MNCKQTQSKLMDYHDGNLEPANTSQVEKHLSDCVTCREFSSELSQFQLLLKPEKKPVADPFLTQRILNQVAKEPAGSYSTQLSFASKITAVAAIAALVLIGIIGGLELGNQITSGLSSEESKSSEIASLVNEMKLEPLEQILLNLSNSDQ